MYFVIFSSNVLSRCISFNNFLLHSTDLATFTPDANFFSMFIIFLALPDDAYSNLLRLAVKSHPRFLTTDLKRT